MTSSLLELLVAAKNLLLIKYYFSMYREIGNINCLARVFNIFVDPSPDVFATIPDTNSPWHD